MRYKQSKSINLVLTLVLSLSLCLLPTGLCYADNPFAPNRLANLDISRELHVKLMESFSQEPIPDASDYSDWYGGSYMNEQGKLVIYITPDYFKDVQLSKVKEEVITIVGSDDILFEPCEYSFRHLTEMMDYLNSIKMSPSKSTIGDSFNSLCIDDSGCIIFAKSEGVTVFLGDIDPGEKIQSKSMGFTAHWTKFNGIQGIIAAVHVVPCLMRPLSVILVPMVLKQHYGKIQAAAS